MLSGPLPAETLSVWQPETSVLICSEADNILTYFGSLMVDCIWSIQLIPKVVYCSHSVKKCVMSIYPRTHAKSETTTRCAGLKPRCFQILKTSGEQ